MPKSYSEDSYVPFPHDSSYRFLLSSKKLFMELLRSFVRQEWVKQVDETSLEEINHSFVLPDFQRREADLIFKARLDERELVFYLLVEMQSTVDMEMPLRLLMYQTEIWRYVMRNRGDYEAAAKSSLPAIVPIVLYNGSRPWTAKRRFRDLLAGEEAFGTELLDFEYILLDVERYTEEELLGLSNTIGSVFLLDQTTDQQQLLDRLRKLLQTIRRMPEASKEQFINWLVRIIAVQLPADSVEVEQLIQELKGEGEGFMGFQENLQAIRKKGFEEGIEKGIEQGMEQGMEKGIEQGQLLAKEAVAKNLIGMGLDNQAIALATDFTEETIERLRKEVH